MSKKAIIAVVLFLFAVTVPASAGDTAGIKWRSYQEGIAQARMEDKKIFLHFYADWCAYCKQMEQSTFRETAVLSYLNKHFIPIKVNTDRESTIARRYNVRPIPDNWFMQKDGARIANRPGYIAPDDLYLLLKYYNTDSYKKMAYGKFVETSH